MLLRFTGILTLPECRRRVVTRFKHLPSGTRGRQTKDPKYSLDGSNPTGWSRGGRVCVCLWCCSSAVYDHYLAEPAGLLCTVPPLICYAFCCTSHTHMSHSLLWVHVACRTSVNSSGRCRSCTQRMFYELAIWLLPVRKIIPRD